MKKSNVKVTVFDYKNYNVYIIEDLDRFIFAIQTKGGGTVNTMMGLPKKQPNLPDYIETFDSVLNFIEENIEEYIEWHEKDMDHEEFIHETFYGMMDYLNEVNKNKGDD